jgi:hypothetical protein
VNSFMYFDVNGRTTSFSTLLTYIGFLTTLRFYMSWKITGPMEGFPTLFTCMFCSSVNFFLSFFLFLGNWMTWMLFYIASKWSALRVKSWVFQVTGRTKGFSTLFAFIGFLCTISSFMFLNSTQMWEGFPTWLTNRVFLHCKSVQVCKGH